MRAVTQLQRFTGKKNSGKKIPGRKLGVTFQGGGAPPSTQYLGSVQNYCGFTKGLGFTVKYQRGARQGHSEGQIPCWNLVSENATGLVENSIPRGGCMHSHGIFTPIGGLKACKRHLQTCPVLAAWNSLFRRNFAAGKDRTQGEDKAKQGSAPLPGTQLFLSPKK